MKKHKVAKHARLKGRETGWDRSLWERKKEQGLTASKEGEKQVGKKI